MDIESMARYWSQDAENYGVIIRKELVSFRVEAWQNYLREKLPADTRKVLDLGCITEPFDPLQLPLSGIKRPYWDVELLRNMGFGDVHTEFDVTDKFWDDKERLLYGETPMFGVFATKF